MSGGLSKTPRGISTAAGLTNKRYGASLCGFTSFVPGLPATFIGVLATAKPAKHER